MTIFDLDDVVKGDSYPRPLTVYELNDSVFDLTGSTILLTVKHQNDRKSDDSDAIFQLSWEDGGAANGMNVSEPSSGIISVEMSPAQTALLISGQTYKYDVQVEIGSRKYTPIAGKIYVRSDTTRS